MKSGGYVPLKIAVAWLGGTYALFLLVGEVTKVPDLFKLTVFIGATIASLTVGYWWRTKLYEGASSPPERTETLTGIKALTALSALYYLAYGVVYMREFGVLSASAVADAIRNPGGAYLAKFEVFDTQLATDANNPAAQALTLVAALSAPLVPFLIVYWRHLTQDIKLLAAIGLAAYAGLFLAIGTLVGLGNLLIFAVIGYLVARQRGAAQGRRRRRALTAAVILAGLAFAGYMSYNQSARIEAVGITGKFEPNPIVRAVTPDDFARGVTVMAFYPTHGYQGLAYNLDTPFEWTKLRGGARALDSYLAQYGFGDSVAARTYAERTEDRMGWDAGFTWSTIYPWLASDLHWSGAIVFVGVVGWWLSRFWHEAVAGSRLSLLLLGQLGVLIAYVPANHQLGLSRPNLICFTTLVLVYAVRSLSKSPSGKPPRRAAAPTPAVEGRLAMPGDRA